MSAIIKGHPSTNDGHQLNTTTLIRHAARNYPEREIVYRAADDGWGRYTYADAYARVQRIASALTGLGVAPGDVVGILDWNSKRHFELYWAIPGVGAVMLQMNLRLGSEDLGYVATHAGTSVILVDDSLLGVAEAIAPLVPEVTWVVMTDNPLSEVSTTLPGIRHFEDLVEAASGEFEWPVIDESSAYSACYTTGTTGRPKGVYYSHRAICLHTLTQASSYRMEPDDVVMLITPMFHSQSWGLPQSAVYVAAQIVLPGPYSVGDVNMLADVMIAEGVTVANGAPAIFQPILDYIRTLEVTPDFSRTRLLSGATEPTLSLMRGFHDETGADFIHAYGATETAPMAFVNYGRKVTLLGTLSEDEWWDFKRYQGLPANGVDVRIVDVDGTDVPRDGVSQGEILLRGPWITARYHELDDNEDHFLDGYWRSGDIGVIDQNGYLKLTDRLKDVIKSGGEWISSIDMENVIVSHPRVAEAAVIGVPHQKWQERPVVILVSADGRDITLDELTELLEPRFAKWQFPDTVVHVDELPRTSVGKLDKKRMRAHHDHLYAGA